MFKYKTLHHNEHGYVIKCSQSSPIQIGFGYFALANTENEFAEFGRMINNCYEENKDSFGFVPGQKRIQDSTPPRNMFWVFSLNELKRFTELLSQAHISLELEKIFTTVENEN